MKKLLVLLIINAYLLIAISANSQNNDFVFTHREVQKAINNNTRSIDGTPGNAYWQNYCNYDIKAEVFVDKFRINGEETLTYFNNSPDTLKKLYFTNIQDLFKKGVQRDWDLGSIDIHDGVEIHEVIIDGKSINLEPKQKQIYHRSTDFIIRLDDYFAPKSKHSIYIKWTNIIPEHTTVRNGVYNKTNMMLGYWFPKIKVYDDVYGWAYISHTGNAEFYNEFGNYKVEITTPKGYMLWSTGVLQNAHDNFTRKIVKRIAKASKSDDVINIITTDDIKDNLVFHKNMKHKWVLTMDSVSDFAFAISKDYIWDALSIDIDGRRVNINAVYKSNSVDFYKVAKVIYNVLDFYSNTNPKIAYPFSQMTAFNGGGGMEYPAMVNDGDNERLNGTLYLTAHEVGHTYFPFNTGLNEQRYAWMDEGLITYFPRKFVKKYTNDSSFTVQGDLLKSYDKLAATDKEIPLMVPSFNTGTTYRYQAYTKSSVAFYELCSYLGEEIFNESLREFSKNWEHKHPTAYDFFNTFNRVSKQDLYWFWNTWFFEMKNANLAIGEYKKGKLAIINKGGLPVAIRIEISNEVETKSMIIKADVWKTSNVYFIDIPIEFKLKKAVLSTLETPDVDHSDNVVEF